MARLHAATPPATPTDNSRSPVEHRTTIRLALVVCAALCVRGFFLWLRGDYLDWDEAMYLLIARNFGAGQGITLNGFPHTALSPFVPIASALVGRLADLDLLTAQRILSAGFGAVLPIPIFLLLRRHTTERVSWYAVSLLVAWPALIDTAPKLGPIWQHMYAGSEPTYLFFLFASLASGEAALRRRGGVAVASASLAGALMAVAYLARAEAVVFAGVYVVVRAIQELRGQVRPRVLTVPALAALAFMLLAGPQLVRLHRVSGIWMLSGQTAVMAPAAGTLQESFRDDRYLVDFVRTWYRLDSGHSHLLNPYWGIPEEVQPAVQRSQFARLAEIETPQSRSPIQRIGNRLANYGYMLWTLTGPFFAMFVVIGLVVSRRQSTPPFVLAGFATSLIVGLYLAVLPRFFLYLVPALALWAAYGIEAISRVVRARERLVARALVVLLVGLSLASVGRRATSDLAQRLAVVGFEDRMAGQLLAAALPSGQPVMHWHPRFAYWDGWEWRTMPMASLDGLAHYAARVGVGHVLIARGGYTPINPGVSHFLLILDPELTTRLRNLSVAGDGSHVHPTMTVTRAEPVAGYSAGLVSLRTPEAE